MNTNLRKIYPNEKIEDYKEMKRQETKIEENKRKQEERRTKERKGKRVIRHPKDIISFVPIIL